MSLDEQHRTRTQDRRGQPAASTGSRRGDHRPPAHLGGARSTDGCQGGPNVRQALVGVPSSVHHWEDSSARRTGGRAGRTTLFRSPAHDSSREMLVMEIATAPHRPDPSPWGRLAVLLGIFAPVTLLALLPIGFGLERYVVTGDSMSGAYDRGSVVFERVVPVSDLRVGDVITFDPPASAEVDGMVTSRIISIDGDSVRTQ